LDLSRLSEAIFKIDLHYFSSFNSFINAIAPDDHDGNGARFPHVVNGFGFARLQKIFGARDAKRFFQFGFDSDFGDRFPVRKLVLHIFHVRLSVLHQERIFSKHCIGIICDNAGFDLWLDLFGSRFIFPS